MSSAIFIASALVSQFLRIRFPIRPLGTLSLHFPVSLPLKIYGMMVIAPLFTRTAFMRFSSFENAHALYPRAILARRRLPAGSIALHRALAVRGVGHRRRHPVGNRDGAGRVRD